MVLYVAFLRALFVLKVGATTILRLPLPYTRMTASASASAEYMSSRLFVIFLCGDLLPFGDGERRFCGDFDAFCELRLLGDRFPTVGDFLWVEVCDFLRCVFRDHL